MVISAAVSGRAASSLVNSGNNFSPRGTGAERKERRKRSYRLRKTSGRILPEQQVARCGWGLSDNIHVMHGEDGTCFHGVSSCKSVWMCPVCAPRIAAKRREQVREFLDAHKRAGGKTYMTALTMPHTRKQSVAELRAVITKFWHSVTSGERWQKLCEEAGCIGFNRSFEITYGSTFGWHPHFHFLFHFTMYSTSEDRKRFGVLLFERWAKFVEKAGYGKCNANIYTFEECKDANASADYIAKWGAEYEIVSSLTKRASDGNKSPWQLLEAADKGDKQAWALFAEYAIAFKGTRQLVWSQGLRKIYDLDEPGSDKELDIEENAPNHVGHIPRDAYKEISRDGLICEFMERVDAAPVWETVKRFFREYGYDLQGCLGPGDGLRRQDTMGTLPS